MLSFKCEDIGEEGRVIASGIRDEIIDVYCGGKD